MTVIGVTTAKIDGWDTSPNTQYHVQTDEGPERYFRYQTISGQYRKEKRLQDGTVVGSYGWVDADGYLRLNDYIADSDGYRVLRMKRLFVGSQKSVSPVLQTTKYISTSIGTDASSSISREAQPYVEDKSKFLIFPSTTVAPIAAAPNFPKRRPTVPASYYPTSTLSTMIRDATAKADIVITPTPQFYVSDMKSLYPSSKFSYKAPLYTTIIKAGSRHNQNSVNPYYGNKLYAANKKLYEESPNYDNISVSRNGFRYYLPQQYHEEENSTENKRVGSFGYIDPFGIRRVIYYNTSPEVGFVHRKNNRYVGFNDTPYDPRL